MTEPTGFPGRDPDGGPAAPLASLGDRLVAQLVDGLVAFGVYFFAGTLLAPRFGGATESGFKLTGGPALLLMAIAGAILLAYFTVAEAVGGATLGKLAAGIQVQTLQGGRVGAGASVVRNLMRLVDAVGVYLVAAIAVMLTRRHQRLGDLAAGTVVVRREAGRARRALALVLALAVAVAGIGGGLWLRHRPGGLIAMAEAAEPHPTLDRYRPQEPGAAIKAVSLSASDRDVFDGKRVATVFPEGVGRIVVWYRWEGARKGLRLDIRWSLEGAVVLEEGEAVDKAAGTAAWILKTGGGPLPAGSYTVELLESGKPVAAIPFRIGGKAGTDVVMLEQYKPRAAGAAIKAVSLSASDSDDFDSKRVGTEFPEGVTRVVVSYVWEGAGQGHRVDSRWLRGESLVVEKGQVLPSPTGFGVFSAGPLPAGAYRVELLENGKPVTAIPFRVGAGR